MSKTYKDIKARGDKGTPKRVRRQITRSQGKRELRREVEQYNDAE